jgi:hypothetical protein
VLSATIAALEAVPLDELERHRRLQAGTLGEVVHRFGLRSSRICCTRLEESPTASATRRRGSPASLARTIAVSRRCRASSSCSAARRSSVSNGMCSILNGHAIDLGPSWTGQPRAGARHCHGIVMARRCNVTERLSDARNPRRSRAFVGAAGGTRTSDTRIMMMARRGHLGLNRHGSGGMKCPQFGSKSGEAVILLAIFH